MFPDFAYDFFMLCVECLKKRGKKNDVGRFEYKDDVVSMTLSEDGADLMVFRVQTDEMIMLVLGRVPMSYSNNLVYVEPHIKTLNAKVP